MPPGSESLDAAGQPWRATIAKATARRPDRWKADTHNDSTHDPPM